MSHQELLAPHHATVGFEGVPGQRRFYFQAQDVDVTVTVLIEKAQAVGLAELLAATLQRVGVTVATDWDRAAMALREPVEVEWRANEIGVGGDEHAPQLLVELNGFDAFGAPHSAHVWLDTDQARRLAAHAFEIAGQGRPPCDLCGQPVTPGVTHACPSTNGHGRHE